MINIASLLYFYFIKIVEIDLTINLIINKIILIESEIIISFLDYFYNR